METQLPDGAVPRRIPSFLAGLASLLRPQLAAVSVLALALAFELAYLVGLPFGLKLVFDGLTEGAPFSYILWVIGGLGAALLIYAVAGVLRDFLSAWIGARIARRLRSELFGHMQAMSIAFFRQARVGDLVARFSSDLPAIEYAVTRGLPLAVFNLLLIALSIGFLFSIEWRLALITVVVLALVVFGSQRAADRAAAASIEKRNAEGATASLVQEFVRGHLLVRAFGLAEVLQGRVSAKFDELSRYGFRLSMLSALVGRIGNLSVVVLMLVVLGIGATMVAAGDLSIGALVAFVALLLNVDEGTRSFTEASTGLLQAVGGLDRVRGLIAQTPVHAGEEDAPPLGPIRERIEFCGVGYTYEDGRSGLSGIDLDFEAGSVTAIVGPSGCGKSTLLTLLTRMVEPSAGAIAIDGMDIREVSHASLLGRMAWVLQDSFMFDTTVRENILYGRPDATEEEIEAAAAAAGLKAILDTLPDGYDTMVGEGGGSLSGGQRQRVSLARAFLRRPDILVLDEPTSALDPATESEVTEFIVKPSWPCTVIMVTHRLGAIRGVDRIFVLKDGKLFEQGTHDALLAAGGVYHDLWSKQNGFEISGDGARAAVEASRLKDIPLFADIDPNHLEAIAERFSTERFEEGEAIIVEGREGVRFYVIVRGSVDVVTRDESGAERHLATQETGDYVGEIALVEDVPTTATVRARMPTTCLSLTREHFQKMLNDVPELLDRIVATARRRMAQRGNRNLP